MAVERDLDAAWIERAAREPDWATPDDDPELQRRYRVIPERNNRIIRVVCCENDDTIFVVTAFFDRRARRPA
jgi:hypothetical protein